MSGAIESTKSSHMEAPAIDFVNEEIPYVHLEVPYDIGSSPETANAILPPRLKLAIPEHTPLYAYHFTHLETLSSVEALSIGIVSPCGLKGPENRLGNSFKPEVHPGRETSFFAT